MKRNQILKHLKKHGCELLREGANHTIYFNPANGHQSTIGRHQELSNLICKEICKQLDIPLI
ncbi:type II toxin-antitoxin system HicA family toxin [Emticicia sp.]|uniref:type II toxin-antitoxin system HicA family toxin n=1 Tax=Emticicia sp. TaxID=1930953 RepID=UPI00375290E1